MRIRLLYSLVLLALAGIFMPAPGHAQTQGGMVPGSKVYVVTTLADSGKGSLREAMQATGPRIVIFAVGGYITLNSDIVISKPNLTVLGHTAPGTGIVLRNGGVRIRASDVALQNFAIYPGSTTNKSLAANRDALDLYGSADPKKGPVNRVLLKNMSLGWGVDENLGLNAGIGGVVDAVRIQNSIIAEGLWKGGHPKGIHSMGLLLGNPVRGVDMYQNLFAANNQRNARLTQGNVVNFANNVIYGWGLVTTHIDSSLEVLNAGSINVLNNVYQPSADSKCNQPIVQVADGFFDQKLLTPVHISGNMERVLAGKNVCLRTDLSKEKFASKLSATRSGKLSFSVLATDKVFDTVLKSAGSRPGKPNPIDKRIVDGVKNGTLRMLTSEADIGGYPDIPATSRSFVVPKTVLATTTDIAEFQKWLGTVK